MNKNILLPKYLDSERFYSFWFLGKIMDGLEGEVVLDCSETRKIEPTVIPNLLCLGKIIKDKTGKKPVFYIPDTLSAGYLKNYLNQIQFTSLASEFDLFEFSETKYGGLQGKSIDPKCKTLYFDGKSNDDDIWMHIMEGLYPFVKEYLYGFEHFVYTNEYEGEYHNDILEFVYETVKNSCLYAHTASFVTIHSRYKDGTINISISDIGNGFKSSYDKKVDLIKKVDEKGISSLNILEYKDYCKLTEMQKDIIRKRNGRYYKEEEAILEGIYWQGQSKIYGISNVVRRVLELKGWVRINSNDTRIILTDENLSSFAEQKITSDKAFAQNNIKHNAMFPGAHIEIVLPLEGKNNVNIY